MDLHNNSQGRKKAYTKHFKKKKKSLKKLAQKMAPDIKEGNFRFIKKVEFKKKGKKTLVPRMYKTNVKG